MAELVPLESWIVPPAQSVSIWNPVTGINVVYEVPLIDADGTGDDSLLNRRRWGGSVRSR